MNIDVTLVSALVQNQLPQWAHLPIKPVANGGWDNRTFHLGDDMMVRLPSAEGYAPQVDKEQTWLPVLAPQLPLDIPIPLAKGAPGESYPWPWSVYRWIDGEDASHGSVKDLFDLAASLARFLKALHRIDASKGPPAGAHNFHRGGDLATYDSEVQQAKEVLGSTIDQAAVRSVWSTALDSVWQNAPVWVHGDVNVGNLLVRDGKLAAVIDFGCLGVGDPACDLVMAWTTFDPSSRAVFHSELGLDRNTWARARGWALWKALIVLAELPGTNPAAKGESQQALDALLSDES